MLAACLTALTACLLPPLLYPPHRLQDKAVDNVGRFLWLPLELTLLLTWHLAEEVRQAGRQAEGATCPPAGCMPALH